MFKMIGVGVTVAALAGGFLYYKGYIGGSAKVEVTQQGRQALSDGLEATRQGISNGLQSAADSVKNSGTPAQK